MVIFRILRDTVDEWIDDDASRHAGALAFYALLSIAPLVFLLVTSIGLVFGDDAARGDVARHLRDVLGNEASRGVQELIAKARSPEQGFVSSIVGPIVLLFGSSQVFGELQAALDAIWGVRQKSGRGLRGVVLDRMASFAMVITVALVLLVIAIARNLVPVLTNIAEPDEPLLSFVWHAVNGTLSFISATLFFAVLFKIVPHVRIRWREVWIGAIATAALFTLGKSLLGLYLERTTIASPYGAAGSLFVFVLWVYYSAQILFLGAEFTQVYARHTGSMLEPTAGAVRLPPIVPPTIDSAAASGERPRPAGTVVATSSVMADNTPKSRPRAAQAREDETTKSPRDIVSLARDFETAVLVTHATDGAFRARPMRVAQVEDDGSLWFVTTLGSEKVDELERDPRAVVVMQGKATYLSLDGRATVLRDRKKVEELWSEAMRVWFDDEKDPDIVLLRFRSDEAEYWDMSGTKGIQLAFRAAKAVLTGESLQYEDEAETHGKVRLKSVQNR